MTSTCGFVCTAVALATLVATAGCARRADAPPSVPPNDMKKAEMGRAPWQLDETGGWARPRTPEKVLIRRARILVGDGSVIERGHLLLEGGKIASVGSGDGDASGARVIDAQGKVLTPGLVDTHSHLGVYPMPHAAAHSDGNEATAPVTAGVRAVDAFWPNDPGIERAVAGGTTTIQALPGSANLIGGRAVTLKLRRATSARAMRFAGAPDGLKMACGENPKRVYGRRKRAPSTRMGNLAGQRSAFLSAKRLIAEWNRWLEADRKRRDEFAEARAEFAAKTEERKRRRAWCETTRSRARKRQCDAWQREWSKDELETPELEEGSSPPKRDLGLETLAGAIEGRVLVHVHCYRSDDMVNMLALSDEMGFKIRSFHHALEAYKIRDELARRKIGVSTWADWWGFKLEAYDGIQENIALVELSGGMPIVHSDSEEGIRRLNQEAAKALYAGIHSGLKIDEARWIRWVTHNPAWALGIEDRVGTLAKGKDADVVVWSGNPLSVYTRAEKVFIDGELVHDLAKPSPSWSDFEAAP